MPGTLSARTSPREALGRRGLGHGRLTAPCFSSAHADTRRLLHRGDLTKYLNSGEKRRVAIDRQAGHMTSRGNAGVICPAKEQERCLLGVGRPGGASLPRGHKRMTSEALSFTRSFSIALLALLEAMAPAAIAVSLLYGLCLFYDAEFKGFYVVLAFLVTTLSFLLPPPRPRSYSTAQLMSPTLPVAGRVVMRWMVVVGILLAVGFITKYSGDFSRKVVICWIVLTPALIILVSLCLQEVRRHLMFDRSMVRRVAFAGYNEVSQALARRISESEELTGLKAEGFFDDRSADRLGLSPGRSGLLGHLLDLTSYVKRRGIDVVFIALPVRHIQRVMQLLDELRDTTASIYYVPDIFAVDLIQARSGELFGIPVVALCETPFCGYRGVVKRIIDIALAASILILVSPLMLVLALMVRFSSAGPIIFSQRRYGLD